MVSAHLGHSVTTGRLAERFAIKGLAAGTYEVNVSVYEPGWSDTSRFFKQEVTVADNAVSEVTIKVKTKP